MKNRSSNTLKDISFSHEETLDIMLNNLDEFLILIDRDLRIVHITQQAKDEIRKNLGISVSVQMPVLELVSSERHASVYQLCQDVLEGRERTTITEMNIASGSMVLETRIRPARNNEGDIVGAIINTKDITEIKRADDLLKATEERWRFALEGGSQGVWDWNVQTSDIFFSDSYKKLYGYGPTDLRGHIEEWETMIHPDDRIRMNKALEEHFASADPYYESTYRVKTKDGSYKWVLGRGMLIRDENGKPQRMIGTHTDITPQVTAEQTYRLLFYSNPLPMWTYNLATLKILTVNEAAIDHYGYSKEEFLSMTIKDIRPAEDIQKLLALVEERRSLGHCQQLSRHLKKSGEVILVELSTHILQDSNNVLVVAQDITERKYVEQMLSLERSVFELSNRTDVDLKYLVEALLKGLEDIHDEAYTSLILLREDDTIESFVAPKLPVEFSSSINGLKIGPEAGSCGTAMWRKETVIVEDINTHPLWQQHKSLALQHGLQSCWSLPIIHTSGRVMGSFAIYYKKAKGPSQAELNTLERIRNIIRILMEYHWSLDEIKKVNERFDIVIKATHDLIWDWNLEANVIYRDPLGLKTVYGITDNTSIETIEQWLSYIHPDDLDRVQKTVIEILQAKEQNTFDVEYRFRREDGSYSFVYDRGMILRNEEGKPVRMIGAAQNINERKHLEEELLQNELEKQKAINQATVDSQEMERTEIGKELHDNVNQILTTTKLYLDLARSNNELKDELIEKSSKNLITVINEIRQLSRSLMDPTIGDLGLIDSVNDLIENINLTRKLHVSLFADHRLETVLNKNHKLTIFRILQETLNNAIKHAKANTVKINFKLQDESVSVFIKDDGIGFDPSTVKMGAGLKNIQNRVYLVGGTYSVKSVPKQGCEIIINFPINKT